MKYRYTGEERDQELLNRIEKQISREDYLVLCQWHSALMAYIRQAEREIAKTEERIQVLRNDVGILGI